MYVGISLVFCFFLLCGLSSDGVFDISCRCDGRHGSVGPRSRFVGGSEPHHVDSCIVYIFHIFHRYLCSLDYIAILDNFFGAM